MNDWLHKIILQHVLSEPWAIAAIAGLVTNIDRLIVMLLKVFSAEQLESEVDQLATAAKARIEKDSQPKP